MRMKNIPHKKMAKSLEFNRAVLLEFNPAVLPEFNPETLITV